MAMMIRLAITIGLGLALGATALQAAEVSEATLEQLRADCRNDEHTRPWRLQVATCRLLLQHETTPDARALALFKLGYALDETDQSDAAMTALDAAIELKPDYADAYANRGLIQRRRGNNHKAIRDYDRVIEIDPKAYAAYLNRGYALIQEERYAAAIQDYDKAIELRPDLPAAFFNRAQAYRDTGHFQAALTDFDVLRRMQPDNVEFITYYGVTLEDLDRPEEARAAYEAALQIEPEDAHLHSLLMLLLGFGPEQMIDRTAAVRHGETILKLAPDNHQAAYQLALIHADNGAPDTALDLHLGVMAAEPAYTPHYLQALLAKGYLAAPQQSWTPEADAALKACIARACKPFAQD